MKYDLYIQDQNDPNTTYLFEAIIAQLVRRKVTEWRGIYAFATGQGVKNLFDDPDVIRFLSHGEVSVLVGLDAVTDVSALDNLRGLTAKYTRFHAKVFHNPSRGLFHPKMSMFRCRDNECILIVGSGNLTPGGLRYNVEVYSVIAAKENEISSLSTWDRFLEINAVNIRDIDEEAYEIARKNRARPKREAESEETTPAEGEEVDQREELPSQEVDPQHVRMLVARVPAAGGRWHQVHFNRPVVERYFRVRPNSPQRVYLRELTSPGKLGPEEVRPCVMSDRNLNRKIELGAKHRLSYPADQAKPPIVVFREVATRKHHYILLMPGDEGYNEMLNLTATRPSLGPGLNRVLTNRAEVLAAWPQCPL